MFDQRMPLRVHLKATHVDEAALGVAAHGVLHLDDVGAPVGEDSARGGNERELGNLEDPYALHHLDRGSSSVRSVMSVNRSSRHSSATLVSIRAKCSPRHVCSPAAKEMCGTRFRK